MKNEVGNCFDCSLIQYISASLIFALPSLFIFTFGDIYRKVMFVE